MRTVNTVKIVGIILTLAVIIVAFGIIANSLLSSSSNKLEATIGLIEGNVRAGNLKAARNNVDTLSNDWGRTKILWSVLTDHFEVDNVTISLARMGTLLERGEESEALAELSTLREYVGHIPKKDGLSLENVL